MGVTGGIIVLYLHVTGCNAGALDLGDPLCEKSI